MKGRYKPGDRILDTGCGEGRNLHWFAANDFEIFGIDQDENAIKMLLTKYPAIPLDRIRVSNIENSGFPDNFFDHIVCIAVLHFANNTAHFNELLATLVRVVKPGGSLFIRMASDIGIEELVKPLADGIFRIPDGSTRFLLTRKLLSACMSSNRLAFIEPLKTTNVQDLRCMSTLVLKKS